MNNRSNWLIGIAVILLICTAVLVNRAQQHSTSHADSVASPSPAVATLRLSPTSGTYAVNSTVSVDLLLDSATEAASGTAVTIDYPASTLQYVNADVSSSIFDTPFATSGDSSNVTAQNGVLTFSRLRTDTGYTGTGGEVIHLNFMALATGSAAITIDQAHSEVDAFTDSSNILSAVQGATFTIQNQSVSIQLNMSGTPKRTDDTTSGISVTFYPAGSTTATATATGLTSSSTGLVTITANSVLSALNNTSSYDVYVTVPGYLGRKAANAGSILTSTITPSQLIPGDFNSGNPVKPGFTIQLGDVVTAVRAYNHGTDAGSLLCNQTFGNITQQSSTPSTVFANVDSLVSEYNNHAAADPI